MGSRLAESPPAAAHPKNAPAAVMPSPPSPAGAEGRAEAAAAHPDTARRCPPPAGATTPCGAEPDEAAAAAPTPVAVPKSSHAEGSASHAEGSASHGEGSASHGEAPATSHGEAPATAMANAAGPCEATAVRPTAAHGRRIQSQAANGNRRGCQPNRYLAKHHDAQLLCCEHPSLCESNSSIVIGLQWMVPPFRNSPHWPALQLMRVGRMLPIDRCRLAAVFKTELPALIGSPG